MSEGDRLPLRNIDGTRIFQSREDIARERAVADVIEQCWQCRVVHFASLAPIDWYVEQHNRTIGLLELRCRNNPSTAYPTVFLSVRKWLALKLGGLGLNVPAGYVVKFDDLILWTPIHLVQAQNHSIKGRRTMIDDASAVEPMIEIPIVCLRPLLEDDLPR